jgi:hypothetical protein
MMIEPIWLFFNACCDTECGFVDFTYLNKHFKGVYGTAAIEK